MKKKNVLLFFLFLSCFFFLSVSLSAEQMYSPSWGYALDLPEDFVLANREENERYLFQHAILPVDLQIALYEEPQFKTAKEAAEHVFKFYHRYRFYIRLPKNINLRSFQAGF